MTRSELTTAEAIFETETDAAICVVADEDDMRGIWIAKSISTLDPPHPDKGDTVTITAFEWVLQQKGLI